jgi:hypothetical protein
VLAYLSRYTHRVAISNSRLLGATDEGVTFRVKDYRRCGRERYRTMTLPPDEFIRRFLLHVLPKGFHRIRHYGLLAGATRNVNLAYARALLAVPEPEPVEEPAGGKAYIRSDHRPVCPCCGGPMIVVATIIRTHPPRAPPSCATGRGAAAP